MKIVDKKDNYIIYNGSMLDMLTVIEPNSIDSIVCDPPYELGFMGKSWDKTGIAFQPDTWRKCYDALKDGGYLLAFGGSRTFHRIAVAIEDAGFEIRDTIMWLYGSGFPKSMDISKALDKTMGAEREVVKKTTIRKDDGTNYGLGHSGNLTSNIPSTDEAKQWQGWGSQLKPAYEPIIVARKPFKTSLVENIMQYGVGGINIDECRIPFEDTPNPATNPLYRQQNKDKYKQIEKGQESNGAVNFTSSKNDISKLGRFPANIIHDGSEEVISGFPDTKSTPETPNIKHSFKGNKDAFQYGYKVRVGGSNYDDSGSASRYFYTAKASKKDRDEGLEIASQKVNDGRKTEIDNPFQRGETLRKNIHPTVKPTELMQYLVRLVSPKNATILDPFMGSGSTGKAVMFENRERNTNYKFVGIELNEEYCHIASVRIDYALNKYEYDFKQELKEAEKTGQLSLF